MDTMPVPILDCVRLDGSLLWVLITGARPLVAVERRDARPAGVLASERSAEEVNDMSNSSKLAGAFFSCPCR
jgi:hypothetical protein